MDALWGTIVFRPTFLQELLKDGKRKEERGKRKEERVKSKEERVDEYRYRASNS